MGLRPPAERSCGGTLSEKSNGPANPMSGLASSVFNNDTTAGSAMLASLLRSSSGDWLARSAGFDTPVVASGETLVVDIANQVHVRRFTRDDVRAAIARGVIHDPQTGLECAPSIDGSDTTEGILDGVPIKNNDRY